MSRSDIKIGKPFHFVVARSNLDGTMDDFAVDGHIGAISTIENAMGAARYSAETYNTTEYVFWCVPVAKVTKRKTTINKDAPDHVWRAAGEAGLKGDSL